MDYETDPLVDNKGKQAVKVSEGGQNMQHPSKRLVIVGAALMVITVLLIPSCVFVVPPGHVGVVVTLGQVDAVPNGLHYKTPISSVNLVTSKTQLLEEHNNIPTKEGLSVTLETAVLFRLEPSRAADIYRKVGLDYVDIILKPEAASAIRGLTSESEAKALYSSGRHVIQDELKQELTTKLEPRGIIIEDVLLKELVLPEQLSKSIELKAQAEQEAARMEFVLKKEKQEAERKAIEASGIAEFQRIVSEGISEKLLQWKGVEATEKFAGAPNTKIVIMGNGADSLPVILSAEKSESEQ